MLCTLLNSHPEILCHHEIFNPAGIFYALPLRDRGFSLGALEERDRHPLAFLERVWQTSCGYRCVGFKTTRGQNEQVLQALLNDRGVRKIVLRRSNRLKTFVSELISQKTDQWEAYRPNDLIRERPKVRVDVEALRVNIALNESYYSTIEESLQATGQDYLAIMYEALFSEIERLSMLTFLRVSADTSCLSIASVKQNSTDLRELVSNFAELEAIFAGSEMEAELRSLAM
jgi:hypothetical protein